jgi:3-mercaptopropionate dioxygenase
MAEGIERLRQFIGQLTGLLDGGADEARLIEQGGAAMRALVATDDWLPPEFAEPHPEQYRQYLLYCDPWERFSVVSFVWGPGQRTPIHDHTVWGLIGMLRGAEISRDYAVDAACGLVAGQVARLDPGDVAAVSPRIGDIHTVENALADQHPRLRRQYRRRGAARLCRKRRGKTVCLRLRQPADTQSMGPVDRDPSPPRDLRPLARRRLAVAWH